MLQRPEFAPLLALCALLPCAAAHAAADVDAEAEHSVVLELAANAERELTERVSHLGPAVGVEIEQNWLELEFGASTYRSRGATNWELELPLKKPFRLSSSIEVMPGLGPVWSHTTQSNAPSSTWGAEAVIDVFFWRTPRWGWYLEPSYALNFGNGHDKSVSLTAGLFFTWLKS